MTEATVEVLLSAVEEDGFTDVDFKDEAVLPEVLVDNLVEKELLGVEDFAIELEVFWDAEELLLELINPLLVNEIVLEDVLESNDDEVPGASAP